MYLASETGRKSLVLRICYKERRVDIELTLSGISVLWSLLQLEPKILVPQKEILKAWSHGLVRAKSFGMRRETWVEDERSIMFGQIVCIRNFLKLCEEVLVANEPIAEIHGPKRHVAI
jgi:hypothetical protein